MADDIDQMLQGDDQAPASQAQIDGQGTDVTQPNAVTQQTPEEIEFNKLSGSAQERIRKLVQRAREAEEKAQAYVPPPPAPYNGFQRTPDQEQALRVLEQAGVATDEKVDKKLSEGINQLRWEYEQARLESRYDGSHGEPQYVREEVEDFIKKHPQYGGYAAEDVFKFKMFPDEFRNIDLSAHTGSKTGQSSTLRPTKAQTQQEGLTPEYIEQRMQQPDGRKWYDDHLDEINATLEKMGQ